METTQNAQLSSAGALLSGAPFRLAEYGFQANALQAYREDDGRTYITVFDKGQPKKIAVNASTLLHRDDWKEIDRTVGTVARNRLTIVADLRAAGLTRNLGGLGTIIAEYERTGDMGPARLDMSAASRGDEDTVDFDFAGVPVPIAHKGFRLDLRRLLASRRNGEGLDTTQTEIATNKVAELWEELVVKGAPLRFQGNSIYGLTTHPDRNVTTLTDWTNPTTRKPVEDVLKMIGLANTARYYGPFNLYLPANFWNMVLEDYKAGSDISTLTRLEGIRGINVVKPLDALSNGQIVLVQMTRDVIQWAQAQDIAPVEWGEQGGLVAHYKIMGAGVPIIKSTISGQSGIVHGSAV